MIVKCEPFVAFCGIVGDKMVFEPQPQKRYLFYFFFSSAYQAKERNMNQQVRRKNDKVHEYFLEGILLVTSINMYKNMMSRPLKC